jgi:predicted ATP-grasp superfamily ATP-dependent carboligase|uniref:PAC2 family protein n=1 Tax=candidate division WOR-3 bacterium TaxID=2052148 RepID=A0A7C3YQP7_UNCW3
MAIRVLKRIKLEKPTLIAAWPGMGNVGLGAVDYLRRSLKMIKFAEIDLSELYTPEEVGVEEGIVYLPPPPQYTFFFHPELNLIVFEGEVQFAGKPGKSLVGEILDFAKEMEVKEIYTGASFPIPMSHRDIPRIYGVATEKGMRDRLLRYGIKIMESGNISGLNGLLIGYAREREIPAACLLATIPVYAVNLPNPRSWKALNEVFERILLTRISFEELDLMIKEMDAQFQMMEDKMREIFEAGKEVEEETVERDKVPNYVFEKIERLFQEAKLDRNKAYELKRELDKWGLFEKYEDRFLDLFKKQ